MPRSRTFQQDFITANLTALRTLPVGETDAVLDLIRVKGERGKGKSKKRPLVAAQGLTLDRVEPWSRTFTSPLYRSVGLGSGAPLAIPDPWWVNRVDVYPTTSDPALPGGLVEAQLTLDGVEEGATILVVANTYRTAAADDDEAFEDHLLILRARAEHWHSQDVAFLWFGDLGRVAVTKPHADEKRLIGEGPEKIGIVPSSRVDLTQKRAGSITFGDGIPAASIALTEVTVR